MKTIFASLVLVFVPLAASADSIGMIDSEQSYEILSLEGTSTSASGKQLLEQGQTLKSGDSMLRTFSPSNEFSGVLSPNSVLTVVSPSNYELVEGSFVTSGKDYTINANNLEFVSSSETTTAVIHKFGQNEISVNTVEGAMVVNSAEGKQLARLSEGQSLVLTNGEKGWSAQPSQTGAPSVSRFLAEVGDTTTQQTTEDNNEDRRRFLPLLLVGGAVAAGGGGYVVYNEIQENEDENTSNNEEDSSEGPRSPFIVGGGNSFSE